MNKKISPAVGIVIIAVALALVLFIGFNTALAPPPSVHGIGRDGKPMTDEDVRKLADAMSGGKYSKMHPRK